jgi:hypothetical protein
VPSIATAWRVLIQILRKIVAVFGSTKRHLPAAAAPAKVRVNRLDVDRRAY